MNNFISILKRWSDGLPRLTSRWWTALLCLSLMLNLLVGGLALGRRFGEGQVERLAGASYIQLIPRKFLQELPRDRRQILMEIVRQNRPDLRNLRSASEANSTKLADVLEKQPFVIDDVRSTVRDFATGTQSLAARGGDVVFEIVQQLTPEERSTLAQAIRDRAEKAKGRKKAPINPDQD